jgi:hypothetical protein
MMNFPDIAEMKRKAQSMEQLAAKYEKGIADTLAKYGVGVRPSWVSADLERDAEMMRSCAEEAAEIRAELQRFAGRENAS